MTSFLFFDIFCFLFHLFHSLQFSSKLPETWHVYVKIPCADSNHLRFWKLLREKKLWRQNISANGNHLKNYLKLGKLFKFCLRESNRALAEIKSRTYDTSLWRHINFMTSFLFFDIFCFTTQSFHRMFVKLAMYMQKAHAQAVTISDFGNSSKKKYRCLNFVCGNQAGH